MYSLRTKSSIEDRVVLDEDYSFLGYTIEKGYKSDGLTLGIFKIVVNKYSPKYLPCAFMHDYLTDLAHNKYKSYNTIKAKEMFREADRTFLDMLKIADGGKLSIKSRMMVVGVKMWHKIRYGA